MIGYLKGTITHIFENACFIDVNGVGYRAIVSGSTLGNLTIGKETMLYTYMSVSENDITLYGFLTQDEYELFLLLITVNGIGPKLAVNALGAVTPDQAGHQPEKYECPDEAAGHRQEDGQPSRAGVERQGGDAR